MLRVIVNVFVSLIPLAGFTQRLTEQIPVNQGGYYPNAPPVYLAGATEALQFDAGYSEYVVPLSVRLPLADRQLMNKIKK